MTANGNVINRGTLFEARLHEYPVGPDGRVTVGPCVHCGWTPGEPYRNCATDRGDLVTDLVMPDPGNDGEQS